MYQMREQNKTPEKELNETVKPSLPDRVQSNGHKDDHQTQKYG